MCPSGTIVVGIRYADDAILPGFPGFEDRVDGVTVMCASTTQPVVTVPNPDIDGLGRLTIDLGCPIGQAVVAILYKDALTDPNSDITEAITIRCQQ